MDIEKILKDGGFEPVVGKDKVLKAIHSVAVDQPTLLCSGYGVFPDGCKCPGCADCGR